ncbi:hypothetical protein HMJ29_06705 [Hymenobacter taeanensis]|uniref:Uncharacterized protein n=1 Tax=Hymenobacter taeanensis TaxID=2735321 RepID=A0A6M6BHA8_9BACT|nr:MULTISPECIES: hypothetical protein [Hymenobacter]QJX46643.1 hypothetical protein HMJ29_06705 [Hymenobacter taeanensis]UOQ80507.1 hypothetical protein MUN83_17045 [Hymenobacter sp. 5414T-23]
MKQNITLSLLLGLTLAFTAGCDKDDREQTPEPMPEPAVTYSRSIEYQDNGQHRDTTFQAQQLKAYVNQNAQSISMGIAPATGTEGIGFTLDRAKLPATLTGTYTLKTLRDRTLDADVSYYYDLPESRGGGTLIYPSSMQHVTGSFIISSYDVKRQLLSGTYTATLTGASDPTVAYGTYPKRKCNITVTGTYVNVPLKQVD